MNLNCQLEEFRLMDGKILYLDTVIADETLAPVLQADSECVYVINVRHLFLAYPFVVIVVKREPVLFKATEVNVTSRQVCFCQFLSGHKHCIRKFGPYEYPHEDSDATSLVMC